VSAVRLMCALPLLTPRSADKAYRKVIFDLETLRLRREKTLQAARVSVLECRRELGQTTRAVWLQNER